MPHLHRTAKNAVHFVSSSAPLAAGPSVTSSTHQSGDVPCSPVRALRRDVSKVRSQNGGPSIPGTLFLISPLQELLSCAEAGGSSHSVIHSTDAHPTLFYVSHGSSLWGQDSRTYGAWVLQRKPILEKQSYKYMRNYKFVGSTVRYTA